MTSENGPVEDLTGAQVAVVTGASSGIGLAAAVELGRRGWHVALVGRNPGRLATATDRVREVSAVPPQSYRCDFGSLAQVRELAATLRERYPSIAVLANNAGGNVAKRRSTVDGFEETIQSNHLAPFLLSHELREQVRGARIINTASRAHMQGRLDPQDLNSARQTYLSLVMYGSAKQANILFTVEATKRWPDVLSVAFHPGIVRTRFGTDNPLYSIFYRFAPGLRSPEHGARTLVWLATVDRSELTPGGYYIDEKLREPHPKATDPRLAKELWDASAAAVGVAV
jgi:NAD(P)-dependent dehydrogenase (short-subunit alcohol dehydrogenase family)